MKVKATEFWRKRRKRNCNVAAAGEEIAVKIRLKDGSHGWNHYEVI